MPLESSPESPVPVRTVARAISDWVNRLGRVWVEGQLTEVTRRPGAGTVFLTLRDPVADVSLRATCSRPLFDSLGPAAREGARVVVWGKPEFYLTRGSLSLTVSDIRPVGVGALLAELERLKALLAAEGLFAAERKKPLPFLPRRIGLVTGRASAAERDVVENARRRWPAARFEVREVAVQGPNAALAVAGALRDLDRIPDVDVIVVARGGGSVEDLLPFSNEALCRAVAACRTPVVTAIGHETDTPLVDFVADLRASTPTDAGKRVVPDYTDEVHRVAQLRDRARRALAHRLDSDSRQLAALRARPVLAAPTADVDRRAREVGALVARARRCLHHRLDVELRELRASAARVRALSPAATLERGYAVVQRTADRHALRSVAEVADGEALSIRLADGRFAARADLG